MQYGLHKAKRNELNLNGFHPKKRHRIVDCRAMRLSSNVIKSYVKPVPSLALCQLLYRHSIGNQTRSCLWSWCSEWQQHKWPAEHIAHLHYQLWIGPYKWASDLDIQVKLSTFLVSAERSGVFLSFSKVWKHRVASLWVLSWPKVAKARKTLPLNNALKWLSPDIDSQPDFLHKEQKCNI